MDQMSQNQSLINLIGEKNESEFWEKYFRIYDFLNLLIPYQRLLARIKELLKLKKGDTLLDVGAGTGNFLSTLDRMCQ